MKQYKHQIAKSRLKKKYKLTESQISQVYSYKSKTTQESKAKRFASANKAARSKKYYKSSLALYNISRSLNKLAEYAKTQEFNNLSEKQRTKLEKKYYKLQLKQLTIQAARAKTKQESQDILEARKYKKEMLHGRIVAGKKRYHINRTTKDSYDVNETSNKSKIQYVTTHFADELDKLLEGEKNEKGEWVVEPMSFADAVEKLFSDALANGDIQVLAQGVGFGYIDEDNKEVISPI